MKDISDDLSDLTDDEITDATATLRDWTNDDSDLATYETLTGCDEPTTCETDY